ncbi:MAG: Hsp70 family protein [Sandaracinaceae bacterium]|nr:Hsp70 family protein [Sandaracinaceae bacterium]
MYIDRPIGIDLGTTNSEVAMLDPSEKDILVYADRFGRRTVASAVAWDPRTQSFLVGRAARARRGQTPGPVESIKRKMGQVVRVPVGPESLSPEEVSAKILGELRERMREDLSGKAPAGVEVRVNRAVITVPAYFDAPQIEATRRAGELAGLDVLAILQEPTAAAIYHTWLGLPASDASARADRTFLVYDLGGGTFDVSVLRSVGGEYQVLAIDGDNYLGGDDFDRRFAEKLRKDLTQRGYALELDVRGDPEDAVRFQRLVHVAQEIKEGLSTSEVLSFSRSDLLVDKKGEPVSIEAEIGRPEYESAIADLVETTLACAERALARSKEVANVGVADLDAVVLVGGSTRVPAVVRAVTERLSSKTRAGLPPLQTEVDTIVALGAAIFAAQRGGLWLGDERVDVRVTSPLVSRTAELKLVLEITRAPEEARRLEIRDEAGSVLAETELQAGPMKLVVPLGEGTETRTGLALVDLDGKELATLPLSLYRGAVRARASALSQPSVVAKDIAVEIARAGRRERKVLIPRGASLPIEVTHELATGDRSGAVVLRLLQNRLPIKTLMLEVSPELPLGTPVSLTLRCDEAMRLEARAVVAGSELWAKVEPPPAKTDTSKDAVDALLVEAEGTAKALWGRDAIVFRRELEPLATGLREVVSTDPDKLAALAARLRNLIDHFAGSDANDLSPPRDRFESLLDGVRRLVFTSASDGALLGSSVESWEKRIDDLSARGAAAYEARDAAGWRRAHNEAQALYETAVSAAAQSGDPDDPARLGRMRINAMLRIGHLLRAFEDFVPSASDEVKKLQMGELDRLSAQLRDRVRPALDAVPNEGKPFEIRRELERIHDELTRLETAFERLPSLGLVTDR